MGKGISDTVSARGGAGSIGALLKGKVVTTSRKTPVLLVRSAVQGQLSWSRSLGVPAGPLAAAFRVRAYIHTPFLFDPQNAGSVQWLRGPFWDGDFTEGPHDDQRFRLTYHAQAQVPVDWNGELLRFAQARLNYIAVSLVADWGGAKRIVPAEAGFEHPMQGMVTGPGFQVTNR